MDDAKADLLTTSIEESAMKEEQLADQQLNPPEDESSNGDDE